MKKTLIFAALVAVLALTACKKKNDSTPEPTPGPQTVTRLSMEKIVKTMGALTLNTSRGLTWGNGILMQVYDTIITQPFGIEQFYQSNMIYNNGNIVRIDEQNGSWQFSFTYEDGLLKTIVNGMENDTTAWGEVTAYTEDGHVREIMDHYSYTLSRWTITWANGNAVEVIKEVLEPEELVATHVYTYTYDNKPNAYTGIPLAWAIKDCDGGAVARLMSKHNQTNDGYTYNYNDKGYLVSIVAENDSTFYNYIEQTLR